MFEVSFQYLSLTVRRAAILRRHLRNGEEISEAINEFDLADNERVLVLLCMNNPGVVSHLAWGRRGNKSATLLRRVYFDIITEITPIDTQYEFTKEEFSKLFESRSVYINSEEFSEYLEILKDRYPDIKKFVDQSLTDYEMISRLNRNEVGIVRQEQDAVEMALRIAGMIPRHSYSWSPSANGQEEITSFFSGLPQSRLLEDDVIKWDLNKIPGFDVIKENVNGHFVLGSGSHVLHVFHANKNALENTLGVDLIYYSQEHKSFVLVQYKMAEKIAGEYKFRFPNDQLTKEIERMENILSIVSDIKEVDTSASDYRLLENPFFLKFCPRDAFEPEKNEQVRGIIIPVPMWKCIEGDTSGRFLNDSGQGYALSFKNCPRYFDNTEFMNIVRDGWVGTKSDINEFFRQLISELKDTGKSTLLATKMGVPDAKKTKAKRTRRRVRKSN